MLQKKKNLMYKIMKKLLMESINLLLSNLRIFQNKLWKKDRNK
jgi:hypothetical protein